MDALAVGLLQMIVFRVGFMQPAGKGVLGTAFGRFPQLLGAQVGLVAALQLEIGVWMS